MKISAIGMAFVLLALGPKCGGNDVEQHIHIPSGDVAMAQRRVGKASAIQWKMDKETGGKKMEDPHSLK